MSGRRHAARPARRRGRTWAVAGTLTVAVAVCVIAAAFLVRASHGGLADPAAARGVRSSPMDVPQGAERDTAVPDACTALSPSIAATLAPGAEPAEMSQADGWDQHRECVWSRYDDARTRQLTVELRAIAALGEMSATRVAARTFGAEWRSDRAGADLADPAAVRESRGVSGVGDEAYVVYTVDTVSRIGTAVANARLANVLVTVHYSGGDDRDTAGRPLSSEAATDGALSAARDVLSKLAPQP